jgi:hypothetical protein
MFEESYFYPIADYEDPPAIGDQPLWLKPFAFVFDV